MRFCILIVLFASMLKAQTPAPVPSAGGAPAAAAQAAPAGDAENGKKLYVNRGCFQCHNVIAQGNGGGAGFGPDRPGPRLAPHPLAFAAFIKYIRQPVDNMPPYTVKNLSDKEAADIYAFLLTIPPPPAVSSIPILNH